MNDTPITDFNKLKNTLIEIGVDIDIDDDWNEITLINRVSFAFLSSGKFKGFYVLDESPSDD